MAGFDMHIHSTASDGVLTPDEVVRRAQSRGLLGMALTDHDTVDGIALGAATAKELDFPFIPGIEISTERDQRDVHILGYWIDPERLIATGRLAELAQGRVLRIKQIVSRLSRLGMELDAEQIVVTAGGSPGRPHVAQAMIAAGYVSSIKEAFGKWLGRGMPAYVPRPKLDPLEAVEMIQAAGGVAVVAHPGCGVTDAMLHVLMRSGIGGVEVYHPDHNSVQEKKYARLALYNHLAALGGSDFHQPGRREPGSRVTTIGQLGKLAFFRQD